MQVLNISGNFSYKVFQLVTLQIEARFQEINFWLDRIILVVTHRPDSFIKMYT
jgi:hypothetical protein